jgi:hypothetical protein
MRMLNLASLKRPLMPFLRARSKPLLGSLAIVALAAPACLAAAGMVSDSDQGLDLKYMYYWDRNDVWNHSPSFSYFKRIFSNWKFQWDQDVDYVSGASRRLGLKNIGRLADNDLKLDGISGASRRELRHSEQVTFSYADQGSNAAASMYFSDENDYRSYSPFLAASKDFNERNTTVGGSIAAFFDDLHPSGAFKSLGGNRTIVSADATLAQVLSPLTLVGFTANIIHSEGKLGHPYTPVLTTQGTLVVENLPDHKTSYALAAQLVQGYHLGDQLGSVHTELRYYHDDWDLNSGTADVQWYQYFAAGSYVRLRARGYSQTRTAFARNGYLGDEVYRSADIRYYPFRSLLIGLKVASVFPESWGDSPWLPDRWDLSYDHGVRNTYGEENGVSPLFFYQLFPADEHYLQGTFMAGLSFDL